jgi:peptidyl-prolyl cis-trans isomerase B (cyclophilin B)
MRRITLALLLVFFCAPVFADDLELSVAVVSTQVKTLKVGDMANLTVTLTNKSDKTVEGLKELTFDRQSVFLEVTYKGSKTYTDTKIHENIFKPVKLPTFKLDPKGSKTMTMVVPCLLAEDLIIKAVYAGGNDLVQSTPTTLKIAAKNGVKAVQLKFYTNRGSFVVKLFPKDALATCHHFVRHVKANLYNGLIFHRIIKNFMVQGGCPKGTGTGGPGYNILGENNDKEHLPGRLAMAHSGNKDSGGSQFYICTGSPRHLNKKHTVFGEVVKGMDVVEVHGNTKTNLSTNRPETPQRVRRIVVLP